MSEPSPVVRPPATFGRRVTRHVARSSDQSVAALRSLLEDTLDGGYRAAAARGGGNGRPAGVLVVVTLLLAGLVLGVAYRTTDRAEPEQTRARSDLIARVDAARTQTTGLQRQADTLQAQVAGLRQQLLAATGAGTAVLDRLATLGPAAADVAVTGPGVTIVVGDPEPGEGADPVGGQSAAPVQNDVLVTDRDLQQVCNALWAAGAEAIAVDGQRLGPLTAIRQAGAAILVDFLPVASPYTVEAIGAGDVLTAGFAGSAIARKLATYRNVYGATLTVATTEDLRLPAALPADLAAATPLGSD